MNWIATLGMTALACLLHAGPAAAQTHLVEGAWQQTESSAGACPTCRISITPTGDMLDVTANNGWMAVTLLPDAVGPGEMAGVGAWSPDRPGWVRGRPFEVAFRLVGERLRMTMRVQMPDGSHRVIRAVFERISRGA